MPYGYSLVLEMGKALTQPFHDHEELTQVSIMILPPLTPHLLGVGFLHVTGGYVLASHGTLSWLVVGDLSHHRTWLAQHVDH